MKKHIRGIVTTCLGMAAGFLLGWRTSGRIERTQDDENRKLAEKNRTQFFVAIQWLKLKQMGGNISNYLAEKGYKKVAIYGMSYTGERVLAELKNAGIEVAYGIDKRAGGAASEIDILSPDDDLPDVDAVIVSEAFCYEEVVPALSKKLSCPVISLEEVVYESS